jgi:tRNA threonylcarbamoyladenosine biosynthesis protein TsaB
MLVLGLNTSGNACEAALVRDGVVVAARAETMAQGHDARLAPLVDALMRDAGIAFSDLSRIAVVVGPGSFTGVRVGVAFARGLALVLGIPVAGVTSLEALEPAPGEGLVLGVSPAKRRPPERTWWAQLLKDGRGVSAPVEAGPELLREMAAAAGVVMGDGLVAGDLDAGPIAAVPTAQAAALFAARLAAGDLAPPSPVYVRAPDAAPMTRRLVIVPDET